MLYLGPKTKGCHIYRKYDSYSIIVDEMWFVNVTTEIWDDITPNIDPLQIVWFLSRTVQLEIKHTTVGFPSLSITYNLRLLLPVTRLGSQWRYISSPYIRATYWCFIQNLLIQWVLQLESPPALLSLYDPRNK